jgi:arylsulfatase A-like enzyme
MARRLVSAGVPFIEVMLRGWDTHENNFPRVRELSRTLDQAMSTLLDELTARGLLDSTLIVWLGDFGRTPRINERGGRDHFPAASSVVLAGAGVRGGTVIGATSADGTEIVAHPVTVPDLYRSVAWAMNLDPDHTRFSPAGRPLKTVDGGTVIPGLF